MIGSLKYQVEEITSSIPDPPIARAPTVANDNKTESFSIFMRFIKDARADTAAWKSSMLVLAAQLQDILEEAASDNDAGHMRGLVDIIEPILGKLDAAAGKLEEMAPLSDATEDAVRYLSREGTAGQRKMAKTAHKRYYAFVEDKFSAIETVRLRFQRLIWDYDPDARGGPRLNDAGSLIAFLDT